MTEHLIACATVEAALFTIQGGRCFHCNNPMLVPVTYMDKKFRRVVTREHLIPKSRGGKNINNIVLACRRCNERRSSTELSPEVLRRGQKISQIAYTWTSFVNQTDPRAVMVIPCPFEQLDSESEDVPNSIEGRLHHVLLQHMYDIQQGTCFYCSNSLVKRNFVNHYSHRFLNVVNVGNHQMSRILMPACPECQKTKGEYYPDEDTVDRADKLFRQAVQREIDAGTPPEGMTSAWKSRLNRVLTPWMMYQIGRGRASLRPIGPLSKKAIRSRTARMVMPDLTTDGPVHVGVGNVVKFEDPFKVTLAEVWPGPAESDPGPSWGPGLVAAAHQVDGRV